MNGPWDSLDFRKLWVGRTVAAVGFHVTVLAMQLTAAVTLEATPFEMGLLVAAQSAPALLVSLFAGVWADQVHRRPILIAADLARAALLVTIPIAWLSGWLTMIQLYVVAFGVGSLTTLFDVAVIAYVPSLVGRERLLSANSALQSSAAAMNIGGPGLAGVLVQWLTAPIAIVVDAVTYLVSAASLLLIRQPETPTASPGAARSMASQIREGFGLVLGHPVLRRLSLAGMTYALFLGMRSAAVVLFLIGPLALEPQELGLVWGFAGVGGLFGAMLAGRMARRIGVGRTLMAAHTLALFAALTPLAGFLPSALVVPVLIVGHLGTGFWSPIYGVNELTLRQSLVDDHLMGRTAATSGFLFNGVLPVGALVGGILAGMIGLQATLFISAAGALAGVLWFLGGPLGRLR